MFLEVKRNSEIVVEIVLKFYNIENINIIISQMKCIYVILLK